MLIVVRHGRTTANAEGRLLGRLDPDLDETGVAQARAVAEWIGPVDRVVTSPLLRARRTAEAFGVEPEVDERWIELDYGEIDGMPTSEVAPDIWAAMRSDPAWRPPGGESYAELNARVAAACEDLLEAARDLDVVVVTHVSPIKAVVSWALGGVAAVPWRTRVGQPSITRVGVGASGPVLQAFNEAPR
jgi:broad specificity phosphatase PhoE